ncbi:MAG: ABC transporter permease [Planctomycetota bacterium]|jgi:ABC-type transport system involved in multi-copper enzyme maturation permease subunit
MPAFLNWLLRLLPTNPICMRLVQGGSRRLRHLYIRSGYLGVMIVVLVFMLVTSVGGSVSLRVLASAGARMFELVSYLQVGLICLLTPVFMAGAIAQEANPKTWDILLTTPLNNLQVVLGNLFGRLFFVLALLFSSLPLFAVTQFFGGVPGESIFSSYAIAGTSSLLVAAIAITLSVTRTAGRRAVFLFYITVVMYLFVTAALDLQLRRDVSPGSPAEFTTFLTPLNPFLALGVLLHSNTYVPHDFTGMEVSWIKEAWLSRPISTFCWLCVWISLILAAFSTIRLRVIGASAGQVPWYRRALRLGAKGATERPPRRVGANPIAWREATARGRTMGAILARWGFVAAGVVVAVILVSLYHVQLLAASDLRLALASVVSAEVVIVTLAALNMSATAVSREREDGTLDIILTTPIQPGPYIAGKLRGLVQYLVPMMMVPVLTMVIIAIYVLADGFGRPGGAIVQAAKITGTSKTIDLPLVLPEAAIVMPVVLVPFIAFCVMVGLQWSIKSKGTIGSVIAAVGVVLVVVGVVSLCGAVTRGADVFGAVLNTFSPINALFSLIFPERMIPGAVGRVLAAGRIALLFGAAVTAIVYAALVYGMHANMKRTFMMTVRRLAGTT